MENELRTYGIVYRYEWQENYSFDDDMTKAQFDERLEYLRSQSDLAVLYIVEVKSSEEH